MSRTRAVVKALFPIAAPIAIVAIVTFIVASAGNIVIVSVLTACLINLVLVIGLYTFNGNSGVFSFGQMSFMMVGAYTAALFSISPTLKTTLLPNLSAWVQQSQISTLGSILLGGLVAAMAAALVGIPLSRMSGVQAGIASLALLLIAQNIALRWEPVTNGSNTLVGIPTDLTVWAALGLALVMMIVAYAYQRSRFGLRLRATREHELAATAAGVSVSRERWLAFVLSGFICGIGGGMNAHYLGSLSASIDSFFAPTFLTITMLVVGGLYSLFGAVIGTLFITAVAEILRAFQQGVELGPVIVTLPVGSDAAVLGLLLLITLIVRPSGLTRGRELRWPMRRRSQATEVSMSVDPP